MFDLRLRHALRVWLYWTFALALGVLVALIPLGASSRWLLVAIGAGLLDLAILRACVRTWFVVAQYRWFWWKR